jgi:pimeloyl-ACP methyl ester carboxylesterase
MSTTSTLVFVHGFWHGSWCWSAVIPHVVAAGRLAVAVDMAGHGLYARRPRWFTEQPYNPAAVGTEVSPVAGVGLDDAAELLTSQIKAIGGGEQVTVVAHSAAGPVLTRVAQQTPELVAHAVYASAYMPASDVPAAAYTRMPESADDQVAPLLQGDPAQIGALRLDFATADAAYRQRLYEAFYGDVDPVLADAATGLLTPDGPIGIMIGAAHVPHLHRGHSDQAGPAGEVYRRGGRGLPGQPDLRRRARRLPLAIPFNAQRGGRHHHPPRLTRSQSSIHAAELRNRRAGARRLPPKRERGDTAVREATVRRSTLCAGLTRCFTPRSRRAVTP